MYDTAFVQRVDVNAAPPTKNKKAFWGLFPAWGDVDPRESVMVGLPATRAAYFTDAAIQGAIENTYASIQGTAVAGDVVPLPQKYYSFT